MDTSLQDKTKQNKTFNCENHHQVIEKELDWFRRQIKRKTMEKEGSGKSLQLDEPPSLNDEKSEYVNLIHTLNLNKEERALLMLAYAPERAPEVLESLYKKDNKYKLQIVRGMNLGLPTPETFIQILAGENLQKKAELNYLFVPEHPFYQKHILELEEKKEESTRNTRIIRIDSDYLDLLMYNEYRVPQYGSDFPATLAQTEYTLEQVKLDKTQIEKIEEIRAAIDYDHFMRNDLGMGKDMTPGYMALFYGEPGTGKTLTASVLGNLLNMKVFEVNVSNLVSKYIGETTKNLDRLFKKAAGKSWILVFNEADCLFGKRSHSNDDDDAGSSHANQTISYLLDAIPRHNGVIILTTNMRHNFDKAFGRRISGEIHFKALNKEQAAEYLKEYIPKKMPLERETDLSKLFNFQSSYISIASLNNVVHRVIRRSLAKNEKVIRVDELERCIKDELLKAK